MSPPAIRGRVPNANASSTIGNSASRARKISRPMRATTPASLDGNDAAEVVPLEKDIDLVETHAPEQSLVLFEAVRNEHVFERLPLLGDLHLAVPLPALHLIVVIDEEAVEHGVLTQPLLHQQEAAVVIESLVQARDQRLSIQRAHELQRPDPQRKRRVVDMQTVVQVVELERVWPGKASGAQFLLRFPEHLFGGIQ